MIAFYTPRPPSLPKFNTKPSFCANISFGFPQITLQNRVISKSKHPQLCSLFLLRARVSDASHWFLPVWRLFMHPVSAPSPRPDLEQASLWSPYDNLFISTRSTHRVSALSWSAGTFLLCNLLLNLCPGPPGWPFSQTRATGPQVKHIFWW